MLETDIRTSRYLACPSLNGNNPAEVHRAFGPSCHAHGFHYITIPTATASVVQRKARQKTNTEEEIETGNQVPPARQPRC
jgi:hypothetical protein